MIGQQIFKLQRPLASNSDIEEVYVYNKDRSESYIFPMDDEVKQLFGNEYKFYALCHMNGDCFEIIKKVEKQVW